MSHDPKNGMINGSNGAGSYDAHDEAEAEAEAEERAPAPLPAPPERVAELCAACMRFVASKYKVSLDGTPNTLSLLDNVAALAATHRIAASAVFDQFPYTHHMECGLLLQKR